MRLARNSRAALAAAGALALGGTALTVPPEPTAAPAPVRTPSAGVLALGAEGVVDLGDSNRIPGEEGSDRWEFRPAWDTTALPSGPAPVRWSLTGAEGPGRVTVYGEPGVSEVPEALAAPDALEAPVAPEVPEVPGAGTAPAPWFDSGDGLPDSTELPGESRGETRWVFDAPGVYRLTLVAEAAGQGAVEATYTVRVGEQPQAVVPSPTQERTRSPLPPARRFDAEAPVARAADAGAVADASADGPVSTEPTVLEQGHIDIAARVVGGKLQIHVKDGTVPGTSVWREPSSLVLRVRPEARKEIPANPAFAFLGKAGDPVWLLDQVQRPELLWPGWSTDAMAAGATRGEIAFSLVKAEGPGSFVLYNYDGLSGASVRFNSADGVPDSFGVPQNTHAHGGWAFGKEGVYRLTFTMSGELADGTRTSDTETLTFEVGSTGPAATPSAGAGPGSGTGGGSGGATGSGTGGGSGGGSGSGTSTGTGSGTSTGTGAGTGSGTRTPAGGATRPPTTGGSSSTGTSGTSGTPGTPSARTPGAPTTPPAKGSMAATGAESTAVLAGAAAALAALGTGAVVLTRGRRRS
ncbi:choice-of-anchor M domain-containing protein [Streptomyces sp. NPDC020807]|uniref:choice-of-anchor M domain-containing protein n=1 Tax=Streptomyces sp. NPDC020807 TaxID=3155119 RepID=UPI003404C427